MDLLAEDKKSENKPSHQEKKQVEAENKKDDEQKLAMRSSIHDHCREALSRIDDRIAHFKIPGDALTPPPSGGGPGLFEVKSAPQKGEKESRSLSGRVGLSRSGDKEA